MSAGDDVRLLVWSNGPPACGLAFVTVEVGIYQACI